MINSSESSLSNLTIRGYCVSEKSDQMKLFVARREGLYVLDSPSAPINQNKKVDELLPAKKIASGEFIYGVGFDYFNQKLFWTDRLNHAMFRADITEDGLGIEKIKYFFNYFFDN